MDGVKKGNERDDVVNAEKLTETVSMDEINETDGTLNKNLDGYDISCVSDESTPLGVEVVDDDAEEVGRVVKLLIVMLELDEKVNVRMFLMVLAG